MKAPTHGLLLSKVITRLQLLRLVIGLKISRQLATNEKVTQNQSRLALIN